MNVHVYGHVALQRTMPVPVGFSHVKLGASNSAKGRKNPSGSDSYNCLSDYTDNRIIAMCLCCGKNLQVR